MAPERNRDEHALASYQHAPTRTVTAAGVTYAYRELGTRQGVPVVLFSSTSPPPWTTGIPR